jgi:hypothetical protein
MMESQLRIVNHWVEDWVNACSSRSRRSMQALITASVHLPTGRSGQATPVTACLAASNGAGELMTTDDH